MKILVLFAAIAATPHYYLVGHTGDKVVGGTTVKCAAAASTPMCKTVPNGIFLLLTDKQQEVKVNGLTVKVPPVFPEERKPWNQPKNPNQPDATQRIDPRTLVPQGGQ